MNIDKILEKIEYIEPDFLGIKKDLKDAMEIAKIRPDMSVASLRKITERILCDVYEKEYKQAPKDTIIQKVKNQLLSKGLLPRRIRNHVDTVQDFGNMSIHHTMEDLEAEDIETCFIALATIYKWYNDTYAKKSPDETPIQIDSTKDENDVIKKISTNKLEKKEPEKIEISKNKIKNQPKEKQTTKEKMPVENKDVIPNTSEKHISRKKEPIIAKDGDTYKKNIHKDETISNENIADKEKKAMIDQPAYEKKVTKTPDEDYQSEATSDARSEAYQAKRKGNPFVKFLIFLILAGGLSGIIYFLVLPGLFNKDAENPNASNDNNNNNNNNFNNTMNINAEFKDEKTISFSWDKVKRASKYIISENIYHDSDSYSKVAETKANSHTIKKADLAPGQVYYYKVQALDSKDKVLSQNIVTKKQDDYPNRWVEYKKQSKNYPQARRNHAMTYLSGSKVLMFGGLSKKGLLNDTWIFDVEANRWTEIESKVKPDKREDYGMSYINEGIVVLFGGKGKKSNLDDTWIFTEQNGEWERLSNKTITYPPARAYHAMAYAGENVVVMFGGATKPNSDFMNDVWEFDLNTKEWSAYDTDLKPQARAYHAMSSLDKNKVMLHGGYAFKSLSDTWIYNTKKHQWETDKRNTSKSIQRHRHTLSKLSKNEIILFGGYVNNAQGDTWVYNIVRSTWEGTSNASQSVITSRHSHAMSFTGNSSKSVVFGGYDNQNNYLDDVFVYSAY